LDIDNFRCFVVMGASMLPCFELDMVKVENVKTVHLFNILNVCYYLAHALHVVILVTWWL
jgi:hypothetical protein